MQQDSKYKPKPWVPIEPVFKPHLNDLQCKAIQNPDAGSMFHFSLQFVEILCIFTARQSWSHPLPTICGITKSRCAHLDKHTPHRGPKPQHEAWDTDSQSTKLECISGWHRVMSLSWLNGSSMLQGKSSDHSSSISTLSQTLPASLCYCCASTGSHPTELLQLTDLQLKENKHSKKAELNHLGVRPARTCTPSSERKEGAVGTESTVREVQDLSPFVTTRS